MSKRNRSVEVGVVAAGVALLALFALKRKTSATGTEAYPFPTRRSHAAVPIGDPTELDAFATELGAAPAVVKEAANVVGSSRAAIADYLKRQ